MKVSKAYFRGCLLGGAVGDALGYPVEFNSLEEIKKTYGENGIEDMVVDEALGKALISDDTQMTSFTVDGLLWADTRKKRKGVYAYIPCIFYAYQKWLYTQTGNFADEKYEHLLKGEILSWEELYVRRAPGKTSLAALSGSINGKYGTLKNRINNSKGCGAVMRAAPIGMYFYNDPEKAFKIGYESGAITHGNSSGFLPAGFFAHLIAMIIQGKKLEEAVKASMEMLKSMENGQGPLELIEKAVSLSQSDRPPVQVIPEIGEGWVGDEAMAISLYCAMKYPEDFRSAVKAAVNHSGDSDTTGAICGNILGAYLGSLEIPYTWIKKVELSDLMVYGADRLLSAVKE